MPLYFDYILMLFLYYIVIKMQEHTTDKAMASEFYVVKGRSRETFGLTTMTTTNRWDASG